MRWYLDAGKDSDVVFSSRVRLARNPAQTDFPNHLTMAEIEAIQTSIMDTIMQTHETMSRSFHKVVLGEMDEQHIVMFVENRLMSEDLANLNQISKGRRGSLIINDDERLSIMLGEEDFIRIQAMTAGFDLIGAYQEAERISRLIEERMDIAYDAQFGFLTACPTNLGTGMRASVLLHLPGIQIAGAMDQLRRAVEQFNFTIRGAYGEHSKGEGSLYQLSNQTTLGMSERELLENLEQMTHEAIRLERAYRQRLKDDHTQTLKDRIYRNVGQLAFAHQLTSKEARTSLSDLALGLDLGWLKIKDAAAKQMILENEPTKTQLAASQTDSQPVLQPESKESTTKTQKQTPASQQGYPATRWIKTQLTYIGSGAIQCHAGRMMTANERDLARARYLNERILSDIEKVEV